MSDPSVATGNAPKVVPNVDRITQDEAIAEVDHPRAEAQSPPASTLVTEHSVVFSTAAAAVRPRRRWTRPDRVVALAIRRVFVAAPADSRPKRRHYPGRDTVTADSRMEREMHRL